MPYAGGTSANEALLTQAGEILATAVGLRLDGSMTRRLGRTLEEAAAARGEEVGAFVSALRLDPAALQALVDRITVQETSFFRDPAQFRCLAESVLPSLPSPLTLWSAGCATGQEAYSLAMTLAESGREDWRVLASDVSTKALDRTRAALYSERELRGLSVLRRDRFMVPVGSNWQTSAALRDRVSVFRHNLVIDTPPFEPGSCAVVFCRNVLIYFEPKDTAAFLNRLHGWMDRGSYLFLGFSESLWNITERFLPVRLQEAFVYRPAEALPPVRSSVSHRPSGRVGAPLSTLRRAARRLPPPPTFRTS
jgi:chemotaxis methyl-accepting protein methylase